MKAIEFTYKAGSKRFKCLFLVPLVVILIIVCPKTELKAQEFNYYTQYMFNPLVINPAYAGLHDMITLTGNIREQWTGLDGAPSVQSISGHSPILRNQFGLGVIIINDKVGITTQQEVSVNYSYKIKLKFYTLSLGLKAGFNSIQNKYNKLELGEEIDPNFQDNTTAVLPIIGIGAYLKHKDYYVGLSMPYLYRFTYKQQENLPVNNGSQVFLTGGYLHTINRDFKIRPSFMAKTRFESAFEIDLNANLYYLDDYCVGLSYKSLNSIAIIIEAGFQKKYYVGYSYDVATSSLIREQYGTHEISLNVYLNKKVSSRIVNPRYF